jgi:hypothetical protein
MPSELERPVVDVYTIGILRAHGEAPLRFAAGAPRSYFVRIETARGMRELWSDGIKIALQRSKTQPQIGEEVGVRRNSLDPVSFVMRTQNARGEILSERRTETPRPHWVIERREFFDERAHQARMLRDSRLHPREAVREQPQLVGAYLLLDAARKVAVQQIKTPQGAERFLYLVRESLALLTERGESLPVAGARDQAPLSRQSNSPTAQKDAPTR